MWARSLARKARCGRHGRRQRHCIEVKRLNPERTLRVKCLNCRVTVRKTARRLCERGIKEMQDGERENSRGRVEDEAATLSGQTSNSTVRCFVAGETRG